MAEAMLLPFAAPAPARAAAKPTGWARYGLRDYQVAAADAVMREFAEGRRSTLVVLPTGMGKTTVFGALAATWPGRVFVLAHRRELVRQARDRISGLSGEMVGWEQAEFWASNERLVCASVQTLTEKRRRRFDLNPPDLIIVDEAHHATADSYLGPINHWPNAKVLGVTATPDRFDQEALGQVFESVAYRLEIEQAIGDGWLTPVRTATPRKLEIDLREVRKKAGDLDEGQLDKVLHEHIRGIAEGTVEACGDMQTIVFVPRVETAHDLAAHINSAAGKAGAARAIDGKTPDDERDALLAAFKKSEYQYLINVGIATEGFDAPNATACVIARPTMSRALFTQMTGRVLRPLTGTVDGRPTPQERREAIERSAKPFALLVNFKYIAGRHTLVCPEDILGGEYTIEERALARKLQEDVDAPEQTVDDALKEARARLEVERRQREARIAAMKARAHIEWGAFDPFAAFQITAPEPDDLSEPLRPATPKIKAFLQRNGVKVPPNLNQKAAEKLMRTIRARSKAKLSVIGQIQFLTRHGITDSHKWSWEHADRVMSKIQRNGGRLPPGEDLY